MLSTFHRKTGTIESKNAYDNYKLKVTSKLSTGKKEDFKKHNRVKTDTYEENIH